MSLSILLFVILAAAGDGSEGPGEAVAATASVANSEYSEVLTELRDATVATNIDASVGAARLADVLVELLNYAPRLADDPDARDLHVMGELALARAALIRGDQAGADTCVDRLLTILLITDELHSLGRRRLGPRLDALVDARVARSPYDRLARLSLTCAGSCTMFVDGRRVAEGLATGAGVPLTVGSHAIWVEGEGGPALRRTVEVEALGARIELSFPLIEPPPPQLTGIDSGAGDSLPAAVSVQPIAPRWAEVALISVAAVGVAAGATLWAIDDTCSVPGARVGVGACPQLHDTRAAGISTLVLGASALVTGSIMLAIDERRRQNRGTKQ